MKSLFWDRTHNAAIEAPLVAVTYNDNHSVGLRIDGKVAAWVGMGLDHKTTVPTEVVFMRTGAITVPVSATMALW